MYQVGIRLHDAAGDTIEEKAANAAAQGFKCVHIALGKLIKDYSTADSALTPGFAMYLKKLFTHYDLDIAVLGNYLNLATPDKEALERNINRYKTHLRFASILGCGVVGTETGAPNTEYRTVPECYTHESLELFIRNLVPVVEYAEKTGTIIAIEPVVRHIVSTPERARYVLDAVRSPNLQIIFDPVNLLDINNYRNYHDIFNSAIELLGEDIAVVHIKDFEVSGDKLIACAAGTGTMDYSDIIEFIKKDKPYIHCTLENTKPENAVTARMFFESGAVYEQNS
ncbi:MAG: sugar phosphate isomerase/epimerase [Lachnospiraceae bacterium]|nr:sugar phosphate isomerase/epimerase [Lachnospiraceae bacterium]